MVKREQNEGQSSSMRIAPFAESSTNIRSEFVVAPLAPFSIVLGRFDNGEPSWTASEAVLLIEGLPFEALLLASAVLPFDTTPIDSAGSEEDFFLLGISEVRESPSTAPVMSKLLIGLSPSEAVL